MFYEGTLQQGISTAVGQQKLVFCFVTNGNEESQTWEDEFLQDDSLRDVMAKRAIALRLTAGSEEAGYLAQIFPLPQTPTVVIMKHGELKEYIAAGTTKDEFLRRVQNSFDIPSAPSQPTTFTAQASAPVALSSSPSSSAAAQARAPGLAGVPSAIEQSDNVRRVLEDRAAKHKAARQAAEKEKAADELARKKQQAEKDAEAGKSTRKQAELLKKKKQQESDERKRILKRIQDDREERRKQAQERELQRMESRSVSDSSPLVADGTSQFRTSSSTRTGEHTAIQVRLFDGSTIRSRFKTASPVKHVRQWVDEARTDGSAPYAFRQLLTPLPNRPIDDTEEDKSLGEIGLSPSSTLVLVPIRAYASAYNDSSQGLMAQLINLLLGAFAWLSGLLGLGGGGGGGGSASNDDESGPKPSTSAMTVQNKDGSLRGFEKPSDDERRDHQLYNGNSLNFEPRPDEEDNK